MHCMFMKIWWFLIYMLMYIRIQALRLTNEFRAKHRLPPLKWHQALADIGNLAYD